MTVGPSNHPWRRVRWLRTAPLTLLILLCTTLLLVLLPWPRARIAHHLVNRLGSSIGGTITLRRISWPTLDHLSAEGASWIRGSDTLLVLEAAGVRLDLFALLRGDIHLKEFSLDRLGGDLRTVPTAPQDASPRGARHFPRSGAVPWLPSVGVDSFRMTVAGLRLSDSLSVSDGVLVGTAENRRGHNPRLLLDELQIRAGSNYPSASRATVEIDARQGVYQGNATMHLQNGWEFLIDLDSAGPDTLMLAVTRLGAGAPGDSLGLWTTLHLEHAERSISGIDVRGHARLPGSRDLVVPTRSRDDTTLLLLERTAVSFDGYARWGNQLRAQLSIKTTPNNWILDGEAQVAMEGATVMVDTVRVMLPGFALGLHAAISDQRVVGRLDGMLLSADELARFLEVPPLRDLTFARLTLGVDGPVRMPAVQGFFVAGGQVGAARVDSLCLQMDTPVWGTAPVSFQCKGKGLDHVLLAEGQITEDGNALRIAVEPIWLATTNAAVHRDTQPLAMATFDRKDRTLQFSGVRITGDQGIGMCSANVGPGLGRWTSVRWECPHVPAFLNGALGSVEPRSPLLAKAWDDAGPFFVDLRAETGPRLPNEYRITGAVRLPGPAQLAVRTPQVDLSGLGPVSGSFAVLLDSSSHGSAEAHFAADGWLDDGFVSLDVGHSGLTIDTVKVALPGIHLGGAGAIGAAEDTFRGSGAVEDLRLVRQVLPSFPPDLDGSLTFDIGYDAGEMKQAVWAHARGAVASDQIRAPSIVAEGSWGSEGVRVALWAPGGARSSTIDLRYISASYFSDESALPLPGMLVLNAQGDDVAFQSRVHIAQGVDAWVATVDSLTLEYGERGTHISSPCTVLYEPMWNRLTVDRLSLDGELGSLFADGILAPDESRFSAHVRTALPTQSRSVRIPPLLTGAQIEADLQCDGTDSVWARWHVAGAGGITTIRGHARMGHDRMRVQTAIRLDAGRDAVVVSATTPLGIRVWPPRVTLLDGPIQAVVVAESLMVPVRGSGRAQGLPSHGILNATASLAGTMATPRAELDAELSVPRRSNEPAWVLVFRGGIHLQETDLPDGRRPKDQDRPGSDSLFAELLGVCGTDTMFVAGGRSGLTLSLVPMVVDWPDTSMIEVKLRSPRFPLKELSGFLPDVATVKGVCAVDISAMGAASQPALNGSVASREIQIHLVNGTKVAASVNLGMGGSVTRPRVTGSISLISGIIRLPEVPPQVHDMSGTALLWEIPSVPYGSPPEFGAVTPTPARPKNAPTLIIEPDVDVELMVPGGLWVRGQGLNVEVAGDLRVGYGATPVLTGRLRAVQGSLEYLGRAFTTTRGSLTFYGKAPPDPVLDILLEAKVANATFQITVAGTLSEPTIELSSDPEMPEAEIVSYLLLGRPIDQLTSGQMGLVRERLMQIASLEGMSKLQDLVSSTLGIDMLSFGKGRASGTDDALVVGKYLSPRLLVGYEKGLGEGSPTYVTLEYLISQFLHLRTWTGERGDAAIELSLTKDY